MRHTMTVARHDDEGCAVHDWLGGCQRPARGTTSSRSQHAPRASPPSPRDAQRGRGRGGMLIASSRAISSRTSVDPSTWAPHEPRCRPRATVTRHTMTVERHDDEGCAVHDWLGGCQRPARGTRLAVAARATRITAVAARRSTRTRTRTRRHAHRLEPSDLVARFHRPVHVGAPRAAMPTARHGGAPHDDRGTQDDEGCAVHDWLCICQRTSARHEISRSPLAARATRITAVAARRSPRTRTRRHAVETSTDHRLEPSDLVARFHRHVHVGATRLRSRPRMLPALLRRSRTDGVQPCAHEGAVGLLRRGRALSARFQHSRVDDVHRRAHVGVSRLRRRRQLGFPHRVHLRPFVEPAHHEPRCRTDDLECATVMREVMTVAQQDHVLAVVGAAMLAMNEVVTL